MFVKNTKKPLLPTSEWWSLMSVVVPSNGATLNGDALASVSIGDCSSTGKDSSSAPS